jgi:hypothetical protein
MPFKSGQDTKFQRGTATGDSLPAPGSDTFTDIPHILEVTWPDFERETSSYETLDTPDDIVLSGGAKKGTVTAKLLFNWGNATQESLWSDARQGAAVRRNWRGIVPGLGGKTFDFYGSVTSWKWEATTKKNHYQATVVFTPEGSITVT